MTQPTELEIQMRKMHISANLATNLLITNLANLLIQKGLVSQAEYLQNVRAVQAQFQGQDFSDIDPNEFSQVFDADAFHAVIDSHLESMQSK